MYALTDEVFSSSAKLTPAVLQVAEMLGMYHAELARVLHLLCEDIGDLADIKTLLEPNSLAWQQAVLFIQFYQTLYDYLQGDEVAIYHWLRAENRKLKGVPLMLIVDEDKLHEVLDFILQ